MVATVFSHETETKKKKTGAVKHIHHLATMRCSAEKPVWVFLLTSIYHSKDVDQLCSRIAVALPGGRCLKLQDNAACAR